MSVGCINESDLDKFMDYSRTKDTDAFQSLLDVLVLTGQAKIFQKDDQVYYLDLRIFKETVKIRKKGDTTEYWAFREAIED